MRKTIPNEVRFDAMVEKIPFSTCWYWVGHVDKDGYGAVRIDQKMTRSHRYAYERWVAPIPPGLLVLHKCDTPACVNPDHLEVGTDADNHRQKAERGRQPLGEQVGGARLTAAEVLVIREASGSLDEICAQFGIVKSHASNIKNRKRWKHL